MALFLTTVGGYITAFISGIGSWATMITSNNLIMLLLGVAVAGGILSLLIHFVKGV